MGRKGITYEGTKTAIEQLLARDEKPTIARIRTELGDTGSVSTIGRFKRQWEAEQAQRLYPTKPPLPDPLVRALLQGAEDYWDELMEALAAREQEIEATAAETVGQAEKAAQQARDERDAMQRMNEALAEELKQTRARLADLESQLNQTSIALEREIARREGVECLNAELKDRADDYRARLTRSEQLRAEQAQQHEKVLAAERDGARAVRTSLERQSQETQRKAQVVLQQLDQSRQEKMALAARHKAERVLLMTQLESLRSEYAQLVEANRAQMAELARQEATVGRLTETLSQARESLKVEQTARYSEKAEYDQRIQELFGEVIRLREQHRLLQATRAKRADRGKKS